MEKKKQCSGCTDEVGKDTLEEINLAITWYFIKVILIYLLSVFPTRMEGPWGQALSLSLYPPFIWIVSAT